MSPSGKLGVLGEGVSLVNPLSTVDEFDLQERGRSETFVTPTADGVPVQASDSLVSYHVVASELVALDREIGPDYESVVVLPIVQSTVRRVLAAYRWDQLDTPGIREAQERITQLAGERLRPFHILLESVMLRGLSVKLARFNEAVEDTSIWEQRAQGAVTRVQLARRGADQRREEAVGVAAAHRLTKSTLSSSVLMDSERRAWERLIASPTSVIEILSGNSSNLVEVVP